MSQTVERALSILDFLSTEPKSLAQLADYLGVHKSTASRLVQTLERQGFVRHNEQYLYRLGPRIFALAARALAAFDIRPIAAVHLGKLGELTGQTIHLAAFDSGEVTYIDKYESSQPVRMYSRVGRQAPLYCTGVAKAILAFRPEHERRSLAERIVYTAHTRRTITTPTALLAELDRTRDRGYAVDDREHEDYIHCVAAPIRDQDGNASHAISISATTMFLPRRQLLAFVPVLLEAARGIAKEIA